MTEQILEIFNKILIFDLIFIILIILSLIKCTSKGFVFSLLSASKWLFAYVLTLFLFPKTKPYVDGIIDNEYVLDIALGVSIFVIIVFIILMINKGIGRAVSYSGIGTLDKIFGFFFWGGVHTLAQLCSLPRLYLLVLPICLLLFLI